MVSGDKPDFYSIAEAAQLLKVSLSTIWRWIEAGKLPAYRVGEKRIRIKREDLGRVIRPLPQAARVGAKGSTPGLSPQEIERRLGIIERMETLRREILAEREGQPFSPSEELVEKARWERADAV